MMFHSDMGNACQRDASRLHKPGEIRSVTPEQKQRKRRNDNGHRQAIWFEKDVSQEDVHDDRPQQCQTRRNETPNQK